MFLIEDRHPLRTTAERADAVRDWLTVAATPTVPEGWVRCSEVDAAYIAQWEELAAESHVRYDGRTHPLAQVSYVLGWYADIAASLGAACFLLDRRVPRLGRDVVAFCRHAEDHYPDAVALLDSRFWCLASDPAADHPDSTVVSDEDALAAVLRGQVRAHADDFLAGYRPRARLPRRYLLGAFFDGLDVGFWIEEEPTPQQIDSVLATAQLVLPGATLEFARSSTLHVLPGATGDPRLTRCRMSCCYYFKVSAADEACSTCPRTSDEERRRRILEAAD